MNSLGLTRVATNMALRRAFMTPIFLVGAILGSALFIFAGRPPARWLMAEIQARLARRR